MNLQHAPQHSISSTTVADLLERILDKGIVIAGDIRINLVDVELLTIKIRLLICSVDKAREIGMAWWDNDPLFVPPAQATPAVPHPAGPAPAGKRTRRVKAPPAAGAGGSA